MITVNTIIDLPHIKHSCVFLLEPLQNNFNNSEAYQELGQTSKMDCFAIIVNSEKLLTFF